MKPRGKMPVTRPQSLTPEVTPFKRPLPGVRGCRMLRAHTGREKDHLRARSWTKCRAVRGAPVW